MTTGRATPAEAACTDAQRAPAPDTACADAPNACAVAPPAAALGGPVSHAVSRVARLHRIAAGKVLKGVGLYPGQELLMTHLWDRGAVRQTELIRALELDPSTVTKMLQRLEQTGHVRRRPDPADRRAVLVEATDDSCALHTAVETAWGRLEEQTLAGLETAERDELVRLLAKVEENLCQETADCPDRA
ncbi:MarR family winged helix-turn-helix transcriptional regulator [Streptomyces californicus]|uniref:MarR family winged helix-turn-helix transcriptional regulator n=1 Tax=Streptomyces californicus TaxID=67351 RepID=UPI001E5B2326|nr:MarR family winged helix-turn-helix transcriptional regulator [Streptomyces californicus]MCC0579201.1 MarR family winged helix-turn-helix transcriptional regulator [Streptomyces californicus]